MLGTSCSMSGSNCYFLICIQVSQETGKMIWYSHFFIYRLWVSGSYGNYMFNFWENSKMFSKAAEPFYSPLNKTWMDFFLHNLLNSLHLNLSKLLDFHLKGKDIPQSVSKFSSFITMISCNFHIPSLALSSWSPSFLLPTNNAKLVKRERKRKAWPLSQILWTKLKKTGIRFRKLNCIHAIL